MSNCPHCGAAFVRTAHYLGITVDKWACGSTSKWQAPACYTAALELRVEQSDKMLSQLEWCDGNFCPICHCSVQLGHATGCALAKLL